MLTDYRPTQHLIVSLFRSMRFRLPSVCAGESHAWRSAYSWSISCFSFSEIAMAPLKHCVGPTWPPPLEAYNYLSGLAWRDWAWEALRRNQNYQAEAMARSSWGDASQQLEGGALLTRMREPVLPAEAWALCSFRRPHPYGPASASPLAPRDRHRNIPGCRRAGRDPGH